MQQLKENDKNSSTAKKLLERPMDTKYNHSLVEPKWSKRWEELGLYRWNSQACRENTFVVDTPPPTVSGALHIGHVFSYTQTDVIVRFQRMCGKAVFYPIGWDDNGLPTERRVQNYFNIRCDPALAYNPNWKPLHSEKHQGPPQAVSRTNFIEACNSLTLEDEKAFERLFRRIGQSYDWNLQYTSINEHCRRLSQLSFLDLVQKGFVYSSDAPNMWDITFHTAVAQAEAEDREISGFFYDLAFGLEDGGEFIISTTRPELLPACVAVVAHPADERYRHLFGKRAITPLFHTPVPIQPAPYADPGKGSGILMVCTFGDIMDVYWWKEKGLPLRQVIGADGRMLERKFGGETFESLRPEEANRSYALLTGLTIKSAQKKIVELLSAAGSAVSGKDTALRGEPKPIRHAVKFYEKGEHPLEFIPTRQWFINIMDHKQELLKQGRKIAWHPPHMLSRYEHWVEGLNQDWCISRQRFFGVPFPVWYPLDEKGAADYKHPIFADVNTLPVDPLSQCPPNYREEQRGKPGGFSGDPDVMDTWATSSLTPQIESHWLLNPDRHNTLFPMDIRPQAHDIIRTWAFYTITKAWMHENKIPWKNILVSGFIVDPDRKKMSKSKGNVVTPEALIEEHSADAVRYWASRARLGTDTVFDPGVFKIGRKLSTKIFNAGRFVLMQFERTGASPGACRPQDISVELDMALVQEMRQVIETCTAAFKRFDYALALNSAEDFFWNYCDHYLELVKVRAYLEEDNPKRRSALAALSWSLKTFLRLFAPIMPFVTEELWAESFASAGKEQSVHTTAWPDAAEVSCVPLPQNGRSFAAAIELIGKIRGAKTEARRNLRWKVKALEISGPPSNHQALQPVLDDVIAGGNVERRAVKLIEVPNCSSGMFDVKVVLAAEEGEMES